MKERPVDGERTIVADDQAPEVPHYTFPPWPAGAIPTKVFSDKNTIRVNGTTLVLEHYAPAHTDSDISVSFTDADIFHTGDTWWNGFYPFIDYSTGRSIDGTLPRFPLSWNGASRRCLQTGRRTRPGARQCRRAPRSSSFRRCGS